MDVVDAGISGYIDRTFLIVLSLTIVVEAVVMLLAKYNRLQLALLHSLIVNIVSTAFGYLLLKLLPGLFNEYSIVNLLLLLLITIAVETVVLYLLNRKHPVVQTLKVCVVMNLVSYILFYFFIQLGL